MINFDISQFSARDLQYHQYFMDAATRAATMSYARRAKVGAILVSSDRRIIANSWNGTVKGDDNSCEETLADGTLKTLDSVVHAESNLISFCAKNGISTNDKDIYLTLSPCINCAKLMIQAGIKRVFFRDAYRDLSGVEFLRNHGVICEQFKI